MAVVHDRQHRCIAPQPDAVCIDRCRIEEWDVRKFERCTRHGATQRTLLCLTTKAAGWAVGDQTASSMGIKRTVLAPRRLPGNHSLAPLPVLCQRFHACTQESGSIQAYLDEWLQPVGGRSQIHILMACRVTVSVMKCTSIRIKLRRYKE